MSEKDKAFTLFNEGKTSSSPDVKALGLKGTTKYNYYLEWQKLRGITSASPEVIGEAGGKGEAVSELEMVVTGEGKVGEEAKGKIPRTALEN